MCFSRLLFRGHAPLEPISLKQSCPPCRTFLLISSNLYATMSKSPFLLSLINYFRASIVASLLELKRVFLPLVIEIRLSWKYKRKRRTKQCRKAPRQTPVRKGRGANETDKVLRHRDDVSRRPTEKDGRDDDGQVDPALEHTRSRDRSKRTVTQAVSL